MSTADLKLITPVPLTASNVTSTSVAEADYAAWSSGTTYAVGDYVIVVADHKIYISLQASNLNKVPSAEAAWWEEVGPTNAWSMFDLSNSSVTESAASTLTVVIHPGAVDALYTSALAGVASVRVVSYDTVGLTTISDETKTLTGSTVSAWNGVFSTPSYTPEEVGFSLTANANCRLTITYTGTNVEVGSLVVGTTDTLGKTESGAAPGIRDFSRVETDDFGNRVFTLRDYSKTMTVRLMIDNSKLNKVFQILAGVRSTVCVWYGTTDDTMEPMRMLGYYVDLRIEVAYADTSYCSLKIEGV